MLLVDHGAPDGRELLRRAFEADSWPEPPHRAQVMAHARPCAMWYCSGAQSSAAGASTFSKPAGMTPMTVKCLSSRVTLAQRCRDPR